MKTIFLLKVPFKVYFRILITFSICFFSIIKEIKSQGFRPAINAVPIAKIYGKVIDKTSKKNIEFAVISVFNMRDSLLGGSLVRSNGDFMVDKLPFGKIKVKCSFIGYKAFEQEIILSPANANVDMGNIRLETSIEQLEAVEIVEEKSASTLAIDKRVYLVDKDIAARGGTVLDAMKNIPGITVSSDGSVVLRNAAPMIFVDGRPSLLSLEQIPADDIERIELITNPSAKYVADATGGIINVILKKNLKPGFNGSLTGGLGSNDRYNFGGNLQIREKKFSVGLGFNLNQASNSNDGFSRRQNLLEGESIGFVNTENLAFTQRGGYFARMNVDYALSVRSTISFSNSYSDNEFNSDEIQFFDLRGGLNNALIDGNRLNIQRGGWRVYTGSLNFRHKFPKPGKELILDFTWVSSSNYNNSGFTTYNFDSNEALLPFNPVIQNNRGFRTADFPAFQVDYVIPIHDSSVVEFGGRAAYKISNSTFKARDFKYATFSFVNDSVLSNSFRIDDFISAAYVNYANKIGKIGYQAGLRFEQTYFVANLEETGETFSYIYPQGIDNLDKALFPSLYLSRKFNSKKEAQINFSRKIKRPGFMQLIPFIMFADRQNVQIGNPALAPEFVNLAEINYSQNFTKGSAFSSLYFRQTNGVITNFASPSPIDPEVLISTYINGDQLVDYGFEQTLRILPVKMLEATINANLFYTDISATQNQTVFRNSGFSWNVKTNLLLKLPASWNIQWNVNYEAPRFIPQGKMRAIYFTDLSINKSIGKKINIGFTASDMFNTKRFGTDISDPFYIQELSRRWESRYVRVNLTWKFGEPDFSIFRRRSSQRREPGSGGSEMQEF